MFIHDSNLVAGISKFPQADYITGVTASGSPKNFIEQIMTSKNFIKKGKQTVTNKGQTTGQRMATESHVVGCHTTDFSMPFDVTFQNIVRYLYAVMGIIASDESEDLFSHLLGLLDTKVSAQLPAYTIFAQAAPSANGLNVKAPSMCGKSLKLSGDGAAKVNGAMEWIGSGEYVQPSGVTWGTHVETTQGTQTYAYSTTSKLTRADIGGANAVNKSLCENLGWELNITNTFAEDDLGCPRLVNPADAQQGVYRGHLLLVDTEISSRWKFKLAQSSTEMTLLENHAKLELFFQLLSTQTLGDESMLMNFDLPLNHYKVLEHSAENGFVYLTLEPESLFSLADNKALEVEVINDVEAYTA